MNIIPMRQDKLDDGTEHGALIISHQSIIERDKHIVRIMADGVDLAVGEDSRGQGLEVLANYFDALSRAIRRAAYAPGVDDATTPGTP